MLCHVVPPPILLRSRGQSSVNTDDVIDWRWLKGERELAKYLLLFGLKYRPAGNVDAVAMCSSEFCVCVEIWWGYFVCCAAVRSHAASSGSAVVYQNIASLAKPRQLFSFIRFALHAKERLRGSVTEWIALLILTFEFTFRHLCRVFWRVSSGGTASWRS